MVIQVVDATEPATSQDTHISSYILDSYKGIVLAVNLQTSFLTPPFGFSLFYLRGVTPAGIPTTSIYRGVIPFIAIQVVVLVGLIWVAVPR